MIDKTAFVHPTAIVEEGAVIGANAHLSLIHISIVGLQDDLTEGFMLSVLWNLAAFIIALGVLITVHEFGHFWVCLLYTSRCV